MSHISFTPARGKSIDLLARNPIFRALARKPMAAKQRVGVELPAQIAFASIQGGTGTESYIEDLSVLANIIMILAEIHCTPADLASAIDAQLAIMRAHERAARGKSWQFDGPGIQAIIQALATHQQQITQLGQVAVVDAMLVMQQRMSRGQVFKLGVAA